MWRGVWTAVTLSAAACDAPGLDLSGVYLDDFGVSHEIDEDAWVQSADGPYPFELAFEVVDFDNAEAYLLAINGADNGYFPGLYSRFDWIAEGDGFLFCQSAFAAADEAAARAAPPGDAFDLDAGCGGFAWTALQPL